MSSSPKFEPFNIISATYKTVSQHDIAANVLVPKSITSPGKYPVVIRFHGGGFTSGSSLFPDWFPKWQAELALKHNAIIVLPNYRLLPDSSGMDIMEDIDDFWGWVTSKLADTLRDSTNGIEPDLSKMMTAGESAGGYLSVQLALNQPHAVKACISEFPCIDLKTAPYTEQRSDPRAPASLVREYLANKEDQSSVVSSDIAISRFLFAFSMMDNSQFLEFFGTDEKLFPFERVSRGAKIPPLFIIHGLDDDIVPVDGSRDFTALLQEKQPATEVHLSLAPGGHGLHESWSQDHDAMKGGLAFATRAWLG
ncbi:alpha/beta-hydrolase [Aspergillus steynii IBT 23096]|uniref:Alpha/beta-hydrolase n=1 Tax=Aspergillus steynii IBT 23096 TaxID=1392250 RepID=A0A2I2GBL1_9EURO|nr:alpha/beta-hydrolase [Aspergillus steynii IBT 23096]PLB50268.1 alpha/beta-hydrolase [Aspergillus steynii IBT 23096]